MGKPQPTDDELRTKTTKELSAQYGLTPKQIHNRRQCKGITLEPEATRKAYDTRAGQFQSRPNGTLDQRQMIAALEEAGYRVSKALPTEPIIRLDGKPGTHYKLAALSCTHLGNVAQQMTYLHDFYRYAESKGVEDFWHAGDFSDGPDSMHPAMVHEHFAHTFDVAVDYAVEAYPRPKHGRTRLILGNHDESWLKDRSGGADFGRAVAQRRPDIEYVGRRAADIHVGPVRVYLMHGAGGGAYARSYKLQKTIEGFAPTRRPHVLLLGNYHVPSHLPAYMGCEGFMLPSFEHSTPFITSLGKESVIGGLILDLELGQTGLRDIKVEWRMYDVALRGDHPK